MRWVGDKIILPSIKNSPSSGVGIQFFSITSANLRGTSHTIGGVGFRPSLSLLDDLQSDQAAASKARIESMKNIVYRVVPNLAGVDPQTGREMQMGILCMGTCINNRDLMCELLDHKINPSWRGIRLSRMLSMPTNMRLWSAYKELRAKSLLEHGDIRLATKFYKANRALMDEGAETISPKDFQKGQISGIQFAMDKWCENEASFWTEQQNDPEKALFSSQQGVTPIVIRDKTVHLHKNEVPKNTILITSFIDVGSNYLAYQTTSFQPNGSSHITNYGIFPNQNAPKVSKTSYQIGIQEYYQQAASNDKDRIILAIHDVLDTIINQQYREHQTGNVVDVNEETNIRHSFTGSQYQKLSLIGIDSGYLTDTVWTAVASYVSKNPQWQGRILPTLGVAATSRLLCQYDLDFDFREWQRGRYLEKNGTSNCHWIENPKRNHELYTKYNNVPISLMYDANIFKTLAAAKWLKPVNSDGTLTIFDDAEKHPMFAQHQCNERPYDKKVMGVEYQQWREVVGSGGNTEYLDTNTGCLALANYIGIE